ncbi:LysR family transcriptional regulator [uncultured Jannaschia sp.]|uniref:LysR family transcriptional regulator n=1 Tax=uncultured Jannaschia sp. TaxID=293347 RepID=UPI0026129FA3|nr:LysR family transcriptional regulator [uncultured Jannaschia sp.]
MKIARRNDLSLRLLEVFGTLMIHETTVAAAAELGISQPSVSNAIRQLEAQVGFALFGRERQRMIPTEAAMSLFREVAPLFDQLRSVEARVRDLRSGAVGKLRIMATPPLGHTIVPRAFSTLMRARPGLQVQYDVRRMQYVIEEIAFGSAEVGLCLGLESYPGVSVEVLCIDRMVAVMRRDHPLCAHAVVGPRDLDAHALIGLDRDSHLGLAVQTAFERAGAPYLPQAEVRYCHTAAVLADACNGVAVVDSYTASFLPNTQLTHRPFGPPISIPACLITREGHKLSRVAEDFRAAILDTLAG